MAATAVLEPELEQSDFRVADGDAAQVKLQRVADRYRRPFAAMIYHPMVAAKNSIDLSTLEMLLQMGEPAAINAYLAKVLAGAESPFRIAAKTKASTLILDINAAAGNATKCEFGGPVGGAALEAERKIALQELETAQEKLRRYYAAHPGLDPLKKPSAALKKLKDAAEAARKKVMAFPPIQGTVAAPATPEAKKAAQAAYDKAMDKFLAYDDLHYNAKNDPVWQKLNAAVQKAREKVISLQTPVPGVLPSPAKTEQALERVKDAAKAEYVKLEEEYAALLKKNAADPRLKELLKLKKAAYTKYDEASTAWSKFSETTTTAPELPAASVKAKPGEYVLTKEQQEALRQYTGSDYEMINRALRKKELLSPQTADTIGQLDSLMRPAAKETTLYRLVPEDRFRNLKAGDSFIDRAFLSTTKNSSNFDEIAEGLDFDGRDYNVIHLQVPKGTLGVDVNRAMQSFMDLEDAGYAHEKEVILGRGTKFKVVRVESRREEGRLHIFLKVIK